MESTTQNNVINAIKEARELFNELRSNFSRKETKEIREKPRRKEAVYHFLKEKEQEGSLTNKAIEEYFDKIRPYLKDMIDDHKTRGEWKIQLVMKFIFVSFIDKNDTHACIQKVII